MVGVAEGSDLLRGAAVGVVTLGALVAAIVTIGFVVLFRRRGDRGIRSAQDGSTDALALRAGTLLVRLDDAVREADDELGFAIAQFGAERSRAFGTAIGAARANLTEAFRLKQALDDSVPDSDRQRREWTLQVISLCERADSELSTELTAFAELRRREVHAAGTLTEVRARITTTRARVDAARATLDRLADAFDPATFAAVASNPDEADRELERATRATDATAPLISDTGVSAVSGTLADAAQAVRRAGQLVDAVEQVAANLDAGAAALERLQADTRADLIEAGSERDSAPDAETGRGIIDAMAAVEEALAVEVDTKDPLRSLDSIGRAVRQLDLALASARNQAERLSHARAAYAGTLVSATSQIAVVRDYIGAHGGSVDARTRLAEAERQLMLAQAAADPVEALDTIRRAVTRAQDADALARFDSVRS